MRKLNLFQRLIAFGIDFTVAVFSFQIIAFLLSYFCYLPMLPGLWLVWILYYTITLGYFKKTVGQAFFNGEAVSNDCKIPYTIRILLRECLTSLPALIYWITFRHQLDKLTLLIIIGYILLLCFRKKIFGISVRRTDNVGNHVTRSLYQRPYFIYLLIILLGIVARLTNTLITNDRAITAESILRVEPLPTTHSVQKYVNYLKDNRRNINDYVMGLFDKYDYVILCERYHQEMTQYDMIYNLVTDPRFVNNVGAVFTEIGCAESREAYRKFVNTDFPDDNAVEKALASFMMENESVHLLWPNTNWFNFLKRMYYFNHGKDKKVDLLFADKNYIGADRALLNVRDSVMADNIISTIEAKELHKSLIIMNYRHSFLTQGQGNCGYYVNRRFHGKVATVMINFAIPDLVAILQGQEAVMPTQNGKWDVAFEQMPDDEFAFDLKGSPFGEDWFDLAVLPWCRERSMQYQDMFTGFIYYKAPCEQYTSLGFNHLFDSDNVNKLKQREKLLQGYSLDNYEFLRNGLYTEDGKTIYTESARKTNICFLWICAVSLLLDCILYLRSRLKQRMRTQTV